MINKGKSQNFPTPIKEVSHISQREIDQKEILTEDHRETTMKMKEIPEMETGEKIEDSILNHQQGRCHPIQVLVNEATRTKVFMTVIAQEMEDKQIAQPDPVQRVQETVDPKQKEKTKIEKTIEDHDPLDH